MDRSEDMIMISALQHYLYCPRQCSLIHVEGVWGENHLTAAGRVLHERVDKICSETRRNIHVATSLRLVSHRLGITGIADMVEFHLENSNIDSNGKVFAVELPGRIGLWRPFPVEYKHGRPKEHRADEVQLCAQAMCLEEMLDVVVTNGALFYGETRRRQEITFNADLRNLTEEAVSGVRELFASKVAPRAVLKKGCAACSLKEICRPNETAGTRSAKRWLDNLLDLELRI